MSCDKTMWPESLRHCQTLQVKVCLPLIATCLKGAPGVASSVAVRHYSLVLFSP